ncbi:MAG: dihydroneopterin aldolase [Chitinophagaceae bacterium]|nr:MAG: dihydroneopterin aldolase [Chitinophagaceae bacterium]
MGIREFLNSSISRSQAYRSSYSSRFAVLVSPFKQFCTFTIQLQNVRFTAAHGLYKEEALIGNEFEIDVYITFKAPKEAEISIGRTVDYVKVYQLITAIMQTQQGLLETCAIHIVDSIQQQFEFVKKISITIRKINAPITHFIGTVGVTYSKSFKK